MCVLYVSFRSKVRPRTFGGVAMGSAVLFIFRSRLFLYSAGYCRLLDSYKSRIKKDASLNVCADCGTTPHDVKHLFICPAQPTTIITSDL